MPEWLSVAVKLTVTSVLFHPELCGGGRLATDHHWWGLVEPDGE